MQTIFFFSIKSFSFIPARFTYASLSLSRCKLGYFLIIYIYIWDFMLRGLCFLTDYVYTFFVCVCVCILDFSLRVCAFLFCSQIQPKYNNSRARGVYLVGALSKNARRHGRRQQINFYFTPKTYLRCCAAFFYCVRMWKTAPYMRARVLRYSDFNTRINILI